MKANSNKNASSYSVEELIVKYQQKLYYRCLRLVGATDTVRCETILADVADKFRHHHEKLKNAEDYQLTKWWYSTIYTTFLDDERKRRRRLKREELRDFSEATGDHQIDDSSDILRMIQAKEKLAQVYEFAKENFSHLELTVFELAMVDGMTHAKVAELCETTKDTVKQLVHRNRKKIKNHFGTSA